MLLSSVKNVCASACQNVVRCFAWFFKIKWEQFSHRETNSKLRFHRHLRPCIINAIKFTPSDGKWIKIALILSAAIDHLLIGHYACWLRFIFKHYHSKLLIWCSYYESGCAASITYAYTYDANIYISASNILAFFILSASYWVLTFHI